MELYLLNENTERIAILPEYESLSWCTGLMGATADLKAPLRCFDDIVQATYLERSDTDTILFINKKRIVSDLANKGSYLSAYDPVGLLKRRVLFRTHDFNASRAEIIRRLVAAATASNAHVPGQSRAISFFAPLTVARAGQHLNVQLAQQMSWGTIYEHIEGLIEGHPIRFFSRFEVDAATGAKRIVPLLYEGRDLSSQVIVSTSYGDLTDVDYSFESIDRKNTAITAGQGENTDRFVVSSRINLDVDYGELFVDANDIGESDGIEGSPPLTRAQQEARLRARGIERLHEQPCEHALTGTVGQERFQYGVDYQIGDRIGYEAFGVRHDDIVSEVEEVFEGQHSHINITIGTTYPTIRQLVERSTS
ncbi:MAG: siphovirus ReqiPepy6 Gp37-like family protein [Coriobacteriia bacterium]|nr:siphovirus ReqiPepy6 Gp37-like family protein [Coriobacteriia bacterium]